jgi:ribosomal protein L12E/L44/L45/RPP1/RPP2
MNSVPLGEIENGCFLEKKRPKLDERWIIEIEGSQFVKYAGLLDYAHQIGIGSIEVEPLQLPTKDNGNFAILKATVVSKVGESFTDIGDANPTNCNAKVGKHLLRLASTRAIARALRSFTNVGLTALEELADLNDVIGNGEQKPRAAAKKKAAPKAKASAPAKKFGSVKPDKSDKSDNLKSKGNGAGEPEAKASEKSPDAIHPKMSEAQKRAIYNLSRRRGISIEELEQRAFETYGIELENMSSKDASSFIRELQQAA